MDKQPSSLQGNESRDALKRKKKHKSEKRKKSKKKTKKSEKKAKRRRQVSPTSSSGRSSPDEASQLPKPSPIKATVATPHFPVEPSPAPRRKPTLAEIAAARAGIVKRRAASAVVMTREDYERQQSIVRKVLDPETGRMRLVRGDGEIIEEIVSRDRQREINKMATQADGATFQKTVGSFRDQLR